MGKEYCFKIKHGYIKIKENNAYAKPKIEELGFFPMQEEFTSETGEKTYCWAEGWAREIRFKGDSAVAKWLKKNVEDIYAKEKDKEESKWRDSIIESGYEFDEKGKIIENEAFLSGLTGQLCVMWSGDYQGVLFINLGGTVEFYDANSLLGTCPEVIQELLNKDVIYKKRLNL